MHRTHVIRIYPTSQQIRHFKNTAGACRFAYNWGVAKWRELYDNGMHTGAYVLSSIWTKEKPEWTREVISVAPREVFKHIQRGYNRWWKGLATHPPSFHRKGRKLKFHISNQHAKLRGKILSIQRYGDVKCAEELRYPDAKILSYTIIGVADRWFCAVSVSVSLNDDQYGVKCSDMSSVIGIDMGVTTWATLSDASTLTPPDYLFTLYEKLKRAKARISSTEKGSRRNRKLERIISSIYWKISNVKQDAIAKFTTNLTKSHGVIAIEDLDVAGMRDHDCITVRVGVQRGVMRELRELLTYLLTRPTNCTQHLDIFRHLRFAVPAERAGISYR